MATDGSSPEAAVTKWLQSEGYPLEYYAASVFRAAKFRVRQGQYVRAPEGRPREVDLLAYSDFRLDPRLLRLENVVECKWSGDKPVVIFTSPQARMATSACIAQTIGNDAGEAVLWLARGEVGLAGLQTFATPDVPGVSGRQAFSRSDRFYDALTSVTSAAVTLARQADRGFEDANFVHHYIGVFFPIVLVDGPLFEAIYDERSDELAIQQVPQSRCHWHGSPEWPLTATVDVVRRDALAAFAKQRRADFEILGPILADHVSKLTAALKNEDKSLIFGERGATGRGGLPRLLDVLFRKEQPTPTQE